MFKNKLTLAQWAKREGMSRLDAWNLARYDKSGTFKKERITVERWVVTKEVTAKPEKIVRNGHPSIRWKIVEEINESSP